MAGFGVSGPKIGPIFRNVEILSPARPWTGNSCLLRIGRENCRAILSPDIRALAVEFDRIIGDRKIDLQDMAVA
jgi:hypothetical protein